jgi:hypothetical protein
MIPLMAYVSITRKHRLYFGIPLVVVWLLLLPLVLLLSPLIALACLIAGVNPLRLFSTIWLILAALKESEFEIGGPRRSVSVRLA